MLRQQHLFYRGLPSDDQVPAVSSGNEVYGVGIEEEIFIPIFTDEVSKEVQQTVENNMK